MFGNPEIYFSYILADLFNICLKKSGFPDSCRVSSVVHVFEDVGERSMADNCSPVSILSVVKKIFEKLVNNLLFDHLDKCGLNYLIYSMFSGLFIQLQIFHLLFLDL